eukprot:Em0007g957a
MDSLPEGVPHLSKIIRKPQGIGVEYKNLANAQTGIMLFLEIQEGKEAMAGKKYCDRYPKSVALTLRMTEFLHGRGHVVHGDSAFASVATCTALLEHSTYFSGLLKTAHKEFPRKFCQEMAFSAQAKCGDTVTIRTEKKVHGVTKYIYGMSGMNQGPKEHQRRSSSAHGITACLLMTMQGSGGTSVKPLENLKPLPALFLTHR